MFITKQPKATDRIKPPPHLRPTAKFIKNCCCLNCFFNCCIPFLTCRDLQSTSPLNSNTSLHTYCTTEAGLPYGARTTAGYIVECDSDDCSGEGGWGGQGRGDLCECGVEGCPGVDGGQIAAYRSAGGGGAVIIQQENHRSYNMQ